MEYETYKSSLTGEEIEKILLKSKLSLTDENINKWNDKEFPQIEITEIDTEISKGTKRRRL